MMLLDAIAESRIAAAICAGEFDDLAGTGSPLVLDDDSAIPQTLRVAYRILKNAGYLPPEQQLRKEISQLESLLLQVECDAEADQLRSRLLLLKTRLALQGRDVNLLTQEGAYRQKLLRRMTRPGSRS
jgi:hypothetical protein